MYSGGKCCVHAVFRGNWFLHFKQVKKERKRFALKEEWPHLGVLKTTTPSPQPSHLLSAGGVSCRHTCHCHDALCRMKNTSHTAGGVNCGLTCHCHDRMKNTTCHSLLDVIVADLPVIVMMLCAERRAHLSAGGRHPSVPGSRAGCCRV